MALTLRKPVAWSAPLPRARSGKRGSGLRARMLVGALLCAPLAAHGAEKAPADKAASPAKPFAFEDVREQAKALAAKPFASVTEALPEALKSLTDEQYRDIRFKPDAALWRDDDFPVQVEFVHLGPAFRAPVPIDIVVGGKVQPVRYDPALFDLGRNAFPKPLPGDLGFAGFRLTAPLRRSDTYEPFALFLETGAISAIGAGGRFGASARGLAIDTGLADGAETPAFRAFWIEKPDPAASEVVVYALLDSPSATGAYRFAVCPGLRTVMAVTADLFFRRDVAKLGIAPVASMFFHGENAERRFDDFRPEAHGSDGLLVDAGREWIWRPLQNPAKSQLNSFHAADLQGFGLLQRDRDFGHYQDLDAGFQDRPSLWVDPIGDWGEGDAHLVEAPAEGDGGDNVLAFWWPRDPAKAGEERRFAYRLIFTPDMLDRPTLGRATATRIGARDKGRRLFVIDFDHVPDAAAPAAIDAAISTSAGQIVGPGTRRNPETGGWRTSFELAPEGDKPIELRCYLKSGDDILTETWSYQWSR